MSFTTTIPPIIDEATFKRAFDYLSALDAGGGANKSYAPNYPKAPPMPKEERTDEWPLCAGLIVAQDGDGQWLHVHTRWSKTNDNYGYEHCSMVDDATIWWRRARHVDDAVAQELLRVVASTFNFDAWRTAAQQALAQTEKARALTRAQLAGLETVMANLRADRATLRHARQVELAEARAAAAGAEAVRLREDLAALDAEVAKFEYAGKLRLSRQGLVARWPTLPRAEQRIIITALIDRIAAQAGESNGLHLYLYWRDGSATAAVVRGRAGVSLRWTAEEDARLVHLFARGATQLEIARALPERTWGSIMQRYYSLVRPEERVRGWRRQVMAPGETYREFTARTSER